MAKSLSMMERPFLGAGADIFMPKRVDLRNLRKKIEWFRQNIV